MMNISKQTIRQAKDLSIEPPRSPHETLAGFVIAARTLDKCRATLAGTQGEYIYNCPMDNFFFTFSEISPENFREYVASGADDQSMANWILEHTSRSGNAIKIWNMQLRQTRIVDLPPQVQIHLEDYLVQNLPANRRVYTWFDIYDLEEGVI